MELFIPILLATFQHSLTSAKGEIDEIKNPSWVEVPGTANHGVDRGFNDPTYVNTNKVSEDGDILTYDLIVSDSSYSRIQVNCKTNQLRGIRLGFFESDTRINYVTITDNWDYPTGPSQQTLLLFICRL